MHADEHEPGMPAPQSGRYQLSNVFGTLTGEVAVVAQGQPLPLAPRGYRWVLRAKTDC